MKGNVLSQALIGAMHERPGERDEIDSRKARIKAELQRAMTLVDSGHLACIIVTEYLDDAHQRASTVPYGDPLVVQQTCKNLLRRELEKHRDDYQPVQPEKIDEDAQPG